MRKMFIAELWRLSLSCSPIEEVLVVKETESSVWIEGKQGSFRKITNQSKICNSFAEAKEFILKKVEEERDSLKYQLARSEERLEKAQSL